MKQAVLLLAHGAPETLDDVEKYLAYIRPGRPLPPPVIQEVKRRYEEIGGGSPLFARTREQAEALQAVLAPVRVYFGMRNWHPFISETMEQMQHDSIERIVAICLAPQYSRVSVGLYFRRTQEAKQALGMTSEIVWTKSFHDHPMLIEAFAARLLPLLPAEKVLFTAHSIPEEKVVQRPDPYSKEAKTTASLVAERAGVEDWDFAYQSEGMTGENWLGPPVESRLDAFAAEGVRNVVIHPIGFVSDHVEILYDVDIQFRRYARERGIGITRPESLNSSPELISALAGVASQRLL